MSVNYLAYPNDTFAEDISSAPEGTVLVSQPCQVWKISIKADILQAGVVNFSNSSDKYNNTYRKDKAVLSAGQYQIDMNYPHGMFCDKGLSVVSNVGGVDIFVSYD